MHSLDLYDLSVKIYLFITSWKVRGETKESVAIANNAIHILDYIRRKVASRLREIILICSYVLVRLCLNSLLCLDLPGSREMLKNLEVSVEIVRGLKPITYEKKF